MMLERDGDSATTLLLVRRAKDGDREAWSQLIDRYYNLWVGKYHGDLGTAIRKLYDTEALVQSAIVDAMNGLSGLEDHGVFFAWVTSIIRHKLARTRGRLQREKPLLISRGASIDRRAGTDASPHERASALDDYLVTLDAIEELFPQHQEEMAAVYLKLLEGCTIQEMVERLERPRRTVYRWLRDGTRRLQKRLSP